MKYCRLFLFLGFFSITGYSYAQVDTTMNKIQEAMSQQFEKPVLDTMAIFQRAQEPTFTEKLKEKTQPYLPELYEEEENLRLKLKFPWRDDVDLPFPRGILPAETRPPYNPQVAWQRSAIIPGWGQIYNRGYWKLPVFYAGYAAFGYWFVYCNQNYQDYRDAYQCKLDGDVFSNCSTILTDLGVETFDAEGVRTRRNTWRERREQAILLFAAWHALQIIEAYVNAHMRDFDVSDKLTFRTGPSIAPSGFNQAVPGWGVAVRF